MEGCLMSRLSELLSWKESYISKIEDLENAIGHIDNEIAKEVIKTKKEEN